MSDGEPDAVENPVKGEVEISKEEEKEPSMD